jgi:acid phosphatase type 7
VHRAFYSSLEVEYSNVTSLAYHLEDLVNKYKVDIVQTGHLHDYERSWPTFKGKAHKERTNKTHYVNPEHPVYVVQGTAGALIKGKFLTPTPEWSAKTSKSYGYGRITIKGDDLRYQFITIPGGLVKDEWHIIKDGKSQL